MIDIYIDNLLGFFNKGGFVLYIVFAIALFLWALLIERYMYISIEYKKFRKALFEDLKNNQYEKNLKKKLKDI